MAIVIMKSPGKTLIWVLLLGVVVYFGAVQYFEPDIIRGDMAPDFRGITPQGDTFRLSDLEGQYVLLDFWASWCAPCRTKNPQLVDLYEEFKTKTFSDAEGFTIVSYGLEEKRSSWLEAIRSDGLSWPWQAASMQRMEAPVAEQYGIRQIPTTFFLNPQREVAGVNLSVDELRNRLSDRLKH